MERSSDLPKIITPTVRIHTCEGGARSCDQVRCLSNDPISLEPCESPQEAMVMTVLQVGSWGSQTRLPQGKPGG